MKYKFKKICAAIMGAVMLFMPQSTLAGVLGDVMGGWETDMGGGAVYHNVVYSSASVGRQTENYVEYTPNSESVPVVVNGASVWGKRTITSAADYMLKNNLRPLIGINADYFSFSTGVSMGYTIIDGEIYSKESNMQDAVGFRSDGTAFIDKIGISSSLTFEDKKIEVRYINKWLQKGFNCINLLTDDFDDNTHTNFPALYVVCSAVEGSLKIDSLMKLRVDEVYEYDGAIRIPEGKYVFVTDASEPGESQEFLSGLHEGDEITFASSVWGAQRHDWTEAESAVSSIGGRLLNNGEAGTGFDAGTAPRTAVGVREDGSTVFYTLDGRQSGYSYGAQISTIAKRMKELGCIDAINLDGGGSTAIGGVFPGSEMFTVTNRPSDGALRSCANYLFLRDMREKTGIPWYIEWGAPDSGSYLAGTSVQLNAISVYDTGNYKMEGMDGIAFSVENTGNAAVEVDEYGYVTMRGTGSAQVVASGEKYKKTFDYKVYELPDKVMVLDESEGSEISEIYLDEGGMKNIDLEAAAYADGERLTAYPSLFRWEVIGTLGEVDEDGILALKDDGSESAILRVHAGNRAADIPITVVKKQIFDDMASHWAKEVVAAMADAGIINGIEDEYGLHFCPDMSISRIQFAAMISKAMGIQAEQYSEAELAFTDASKIQPWAEDYVKAMVSLGYINGRSDDDGVSTYFAPEDNITRAEAFTIIARTMDNNERAEPDFADNSEIPQWAEDAFEELEALGILSGFEDNTIRPLALTTRAEAAVLIEKVYR